MQHTHGHSQDAIFRSQHNVPGTIIRSDMMVAGACDTRVLSLPALMTRVSVCLSHKGNAHNWKFHWSSDIVGYYYQYYFLINKPDHLSVRWQDTTQYTSSHPHTRIPTLSVSECEAEQISLSNMRLTKTLALWAIVGLRPLNLYYANSMIKFACGCGSSLNPEAVPWPAVNAGRP